MLREEKEQIAKKSEETEEKLKTATEQLTKIQKELDGATAALSKSIAEVEVID